MPCIFALRRVIPTVLSILVGLLVVLVSTPARAVHIDQVPAIGAGLTAHLAASSGREYDLTRAIADRESK